MSAALRFLAVAVIGWGAVRATTLGIVPGADLFTARPSAAAVPPIVATRLPPIDPVAGYPLGPAPDGYPPHYAAAPYAYGGYPPPRVQQHFYLPAAMPAPATPVAHLPPPIFHPPLPQLDQWPLYGFASAAIPAGRSTPPGSPEVATAAQMSTPKLDRLQLSAWALVRQEPGPASLSGNGMLGGSQAGARLTYHFNRQVAASLRTSSPVGGAARGGEVAAGVRVAPFRSIPIALTAERRQAFGRAGGRSAFAAFLEGGVYQRPIAWGFNLDAYAQAGVVGLRSRDLFADGAFTFTRPVYNRFSAGFGLWGGAQPGLYRVDAGPRVSMRVRNNMAVHVDWRQRLAGNADPRSGPALTLAADF